MADLDGLKQRIAGDDPNFGDAWDGVLESILTQVTAKLNREVAKARGIVRPWAFIADLLATERVFTPRQGSRTYLPIDDCTEIAAVKLYGTPGSLLQTLTVNTDYYPSLTAPIIGVHRINSGWPEGVASVGVTAKWGYALEEPTDVTDTIYIESFREFNSFRAGNDDRVGSRSFGTVIISKAFSADAERMIDTYGYGGASMR